MYRVLKVDGPNLTTDKGCIGLTPFQYADGGKSRAVSGEDFLKMRTMFIAAPKLLAALERLLEESPFQSDCDSCECGENGNGFDENGQPCEHIQACRAIASAKAKTIKECDPEIINARP